MTDKVIENNQVTVMGEIVGDFTYSLEIFGGGVEMVDVKVHGLRESV
ncbi:MAG: single-stranded DNA-binding protein, partial [Lachnospiraceae bacterium]|nr:single-stranded DNA-binding protein [Lachnospiraceae bacterium]